MRQENKSKPGLASLCGPAWALGVGAMCLMGQMPARAQATEPSAHATAAELRRTTDGVAHIRANDWKGLGMGIAHAQAEDALCTLAEAFITFRGKRAYHFGPQAQPPRLSTFGQSSNLDLDVFFKAFIDDDVVRRFRLAQPAELRDVVEGYAAGYNRYLRAIKDDKQGHGRHACLGQAWVQAIDGDDLYRRMYAATIAAGYAHFVPQLVNAAPPEAKPGSHVKRPLAAADLLRLFTHRVGHHPALGSNAIAFGSDAAGDAGAVLLGNPHWYWGGPDRFHQMHLHIPGKVNAAGVAFLGVPIVMIGFNQHVAWSHTVSEARRFGLFELKLDPRDPTRYLFDGVSRPMQRRKIVVELPDARSKARRVTRVLYRTHLGPVLDLGGQDPAFGWGRQHALALRDINADNFRVFRNYFRWNQARSLDEFIRVQKEEAAVPWVNTLAIGKGEGRVWYADMGAVPNVSDALRESCATPLGKAFAQVDPLTPFLDGSRSACQWNAVPGTPQPGAMPVSAQPHLMRRDYVANMNDSYWLTQPAQPLEGFPLILGGERQALSLRSQLGHDIARKLMKARSTPQQPPQALSDGTSRDLAERLMSASLEGRVHTAERFKQALLDGTCPRAGDANQAGIDQACAVLRKWDDKAWANSRGALLWEAFWRKLQAIPEDELFSQPFTPDDPLHTPAAPRGDDPRVATALAEAVADLRKAGRALDEALGSQRQVLSEGRTIPMFGGCHAYGHFAVACNDDDSDALGPNSLANSYMQVVRFTGHGVEAHTLLAHGQRETAVDGGPGGAPVRRYAGKAWLRFPFTEIEIQADTQLTRVLLPR